METENFDSKSKMVDYEVIKQIGRGAFGAAFLVLHKTEKKKKTYRAKLLQKDMRKKLTEKFKRTAHQEMNLISRLQHPYIIEYRDAWVEKGTSICIVTNYCEGGDISEIIRKARGEYFSEEKICKWLTQLLLAINYLHSNRVLHRDLKLSNIFLTKENEIRLGDFGLSKLLDGGGLASSVVGTPNYMCPELLADIPYGYKSDIWSLGCCLFEIAAHQQAFRAADMAGLINKINRSLISPLPIIYSSTLKQIIKSMLKKSPEHRPTAAELLRHPHLQPFLLRCHNPSTVFLPVKSPSPNKTKEKNAKPSPSSSSARKAYKEREVKLKQRDLLPLFDENKDMLHPHLLEGDAFLEDKLETKRVDPTSYSGKISHDNEDSKSGGTSCETTACNGDHHENLDYLSLKEIPFKSEEQEEYSPRNSAKVELAVHETAKLADAEPLCSPPVTEETEKKAEDDAFEMCSKITAPDTVCRNEAVPLREEESSLTKETLLSNVNAESRSSLSGDKNNCSYIGVPTDNIEAHLDKDAVEIKAESATNSRPAENEDIQLKTRTPMNGILLHSPDAIVGDESNSEREIPGLHRADALESLLELCARLLKQDKFDELSGVLKPFGEDTVSSRETAIWLTKSLMNADNLAKES